MCEERESSSALWAESESGEREEEARVRAPGDASQRADERAYSTRGARHELGSGRAEGRRAKGSRNSLSVSFMGFCVNACGKAPVGDKIESYKCCRVPCRRDIFLLHCVLSFACKYLHCLYFMCD